MGKLSEIVKDGARENLKKTDRVSQTTIDKLKEALREADLEYKKAKLINPYLEPNNFYVNEEKSNKEKLLEKYGVTGKYALSKKASNFLKNKAEEQAKKIDKEYGDGTYGSSSDLKQKLEYEEIAKELKPAIKVGERVLSKWFDNLQNHTSVATEQINTSSPYSNFINSSIIVVTVLIITILSTAITVQYKQKNK